MKALFATSALLISSSVYAHPGHDHAATSSGIIHLALGLAVLAVIVTGARYFYNYQQSQTKKQDSQR